MLFSSENHFFVSTAKWMIPITVSLRDKIAKYGNIFNDPVIIFPQLSDLTPEVVKAARIVLLNPQSEASLEHFDLLKKQWLDKMDKMRDLVDEAVDTHAFIKASGTHS